MTANRELKIWILGFWLAVTSRFLERAGNYINFSFYHSFLKSAFNDKIFLSSQLWPFD